MCYTHTYTIGMASSVVFLPDYIFEAPTTITISGSTGCGKTTLIKRLIHNPSLFSIPPGRIIYCYGVWQKAFNDLENVEFHKGVDIPELDKNIHTFVIFDDLMHEIVKSPVVEEIFVAGSHHRNITVAYILQNLYQQGRFQKSIMLNTHYMFIMNNSRDIHQIKCLARQTGFSALEPAYRDCMKTSYGYLLLDLSPHSKTNQFRLKTNVFPGETLVVYL